MKVSKEELEEFLESSEMVDYEQEYDPSSNNYETRIYKKDGKYFQVYLSNGHFQTVFEEGVGHTDKHYLIPVKPVEVTEIIWEEIN